MDTPPGKAPRMKTLLRCRLGRYTISLERKWEDAWIGAFWRRTREQVGSVRTRDTVFEHFEDRAVYGYIFEIWICILPCFPIHIRKEPTLPSEHLISA